jgi:subtilisin family serine protease
MTIGLATFLCCATGARAQTVGDGVEEALQRGTTVRVVVAMKAAASGNLAQRRRQSNEAQRMLRAIGPNEFQVVRRFAVTPALAGNLTAAGLARLRTNPNVARVDLDRGGAGDLSNSVPQINAPLIHADYGVDGSGVTVAVLDSGIDTDHPDLASSLAGEQCFCSGNGGCCPAGGSTQSGAGAAEDDESHGTHVSGIITNDGVVAPSGVAPGAEIVAVKVLDANNEFCCSSDIIAALDWVANSRPDVKVVNMSLGTFATYTGNCDAADAVTMAFAGAIDALTQNGVAVFASSGNDGLTNAMNAPACIGNTISVGGVNVFDQVRASSNSDLSLDLLAPGGFIVSAGLGGGTATKSGTSMASPHAAGTAALLLGAFPSLAPSQTLAALQSTGLPITDPKSGVTTPRIDAGAAFLSLAPVIDSFKCYLAKDRKSPKFVPTTVALGDQLGLNDGTFAVKKPHLLCNPAEQNGLPVDHPAPHLVCYKIKGPKISKGDRPSVEAEDAFGTVQLQLKKPFLLCVPSVKSVLP